MLELFRLNAEGVPEPCADWATWAAAGDARIARTEVGPGYVSTLFLGWRPWDRREDPPLLFETMALGIPGHEAEERYSTRADALAGHARHVQAAVDALARYAATSTVQEVAR
jgi:hypothetical protein